MKPHASLPRANLAPSSAVVESAQRSDQRAWLTSGLLAVDRRSAVFAAALGAIVVLAAAIPLSAALNIWVDEALARHSTGAGVAYAWQEAIVFEAQPPLYFVIEAAWRTLNEASIAFARFPSAVFAAGAVAVIVGFAHRLTPRVPPLIVALITALNPLVIWAATEMRIYALVLLLGAVLTWTNYSGFLVPQRSRRAQALYAIGAILGLYTQYYLGFFLLAQAATLLIMRRGSLRAFAAAMAIVAAGFLPFARIAIQHVTGTGGWVRHASAVEVTHDIAVNAFTYFFPYDFSWTGDAKLVGVALTLLLVAVIAFGRPVIRQPAARGIVLQWFIGLVVFDLLFLGAGFPGSVRRHIIVLAPSSMLVALLLIASLTRRRALIEGLALATFAALTAATLWTQFRPLSKIGEWKRVAATLVAEPAAPVAVFPAELVLTLSPYLSRPIIAIPRPMQFTYNYIHTMALKDESEAAGVLDPVRARSERLWVVTEDACSNDKPGPFDYHCRYLENYLAQRYRLVETDVFNGSFARLFKRNAQTSRRTRGSTASERRLRADPFRI